MQVITVRKPGDKGTDDLVKQYGDRLVCVRYRHDPVRRRRLKTVEIIVQEMPADSPQEQGHGGAQSAPVHENGAHSRVAVRVTWQEKELQQKLRAAGARWSREDRVWYVDSAKVNELGMQDRVVGEAESSG